MGWVWADHRRLFSTVGLTVASAAIASAGAIYLLYAANTHRVPDGGLSGDASVGGEDNLSVEQRRELTRKILKFRRRSVQRHRRVPLRPGLPPIVVRRWIPSGHGRTELGPRRPHWRRFHVRRRLDGLKPQLQPDHRFRHKLRVLMPRQPAMARGQQGQLRCPACPQVRFRLPPRRLRHLGWWQAGQPAQWGRMALLQPRLNNAGLVPACFLRCLASPEPLLTSPEIQSTG
jgi:hypothetical protein